MSNHTTLLTNDDRWKDYPRVFHFLQCDYLQSQLELELNYC